MTQTSRPGATTRAIGLIPVRLESSRLPRKALADIGGLPMIVHVVKRAQMSCSLDDVYVATDSTEVRDVVLAHGGDVIMTSPEHQTGSDRIAEAARSLECDVVVNIQGDEALVRPEHIDAAVASMRDPEVVISMLVIPYFKNGITSDIKVVLDERNNILYQSRADIPSDARTSQPPRYKAYHVVSFRKPFLMKYADWTASALERIEFIEYLRVLEKGYPIRAVHVDSDAISVDTLSDLTYVRGAMSRDDLFRKYA